MATPILKAVSALDEHLPNEMRELRDFRRMTMIWENHLHKDAAIGALLMKSDSAFWEMVGPGNNPAGIYYATDIISGVRANGNIAIWNRKFFGKTEMHRQMMRYVFQVYDLQRMQATCFTDNIFSQRFQERLGFSKECVMRNYGFKDGVPADALQYAIMRDELF